MSVSGPMTAVRLGGLAVLAGSVLVTVGDLLSLLFLPSGGALSAGASAGAWRLVLALYLLASLLLQGGLFGLHVPQAARAGPLGWVGLVAAFTGAGLVVGLNSFNVVAAPELAQTAPAALDAAAESGSLALWTLIAGVAFAAGLFLFGVVTLRAGVYPRPAAALFAAGALALLLPVPLANAVSALGGAWLALAALRDAGRWRS